MNLKENSMSTIASHNLYLYNCVKAEKIFKDKPGISNWSLTRKIYGHNGSIIDRTNTISTPFKTSNIEWLSMPLLKKNFTKTLEECCFDYARRTIDQAVIENKKIALMWSGGIDSTCMLVSFLSVATKDEIFRLIVLCNRDSILENPEFFQKFLVGKITCKDSNSWYSYINNKVIFLTGEGGDQIGWLGFTRSSNSIFNEIGWDFLKKSPTADNIIKCLERVCGEKNVANICFEKIINPLQKSALISIDTISQSLWWTIFCVKWQNVYLRVLNNYTSKDFINNEYMKNNFKMFYQSDDIQRWCMLNNEKMLWIKKFTDIKKPLKQIIFNFDKNQNYLENKIKLGSLGKLSRMGPSIGFITSDWQFLNNVNTDLYYNNKNSFI